MSVLNFNVLRKWWDNIVLKNYVAPDGEGGDDPGGGGDSGIDINDFATGAEPSGTCTLETATSIRAGAFRDCTNLTVLHAVAVTDINTNAFMGCSVEVFVNEGKITGNHGSRFTRAARLRSVDYDNAFISADEFRNDTALTTVINRHATVSTLQTVGVFGSTPYDSAGSGGDMYVPEDLINSYKVATNWSTLDAYGNTTWHAIEGSQYETQYADGTPIV